MAPQWIHCSICYNLLAKKKHKFYHLSCRHVLCRPCMVKTKRGTQCPVCNASLKRFVELNNQMTRKDKMWYDPSVPKIFEFTSQTLIFQQKHREHLIQRIVQARGSAPRLKELEAQLRQHVVETQRRYEKLRMFRRNLQESLRRSIQATRSGTTQLTSTFMRTPAMSIQPRSLISNLQRRFSVDSPSSAIRYPIQPQREKAMPPVNESVLKQSFGSGNIMYRRFSNDSGIGAITPCNGQYLESGGSNRFLKNRTSTTAFGSNFLRETFSNSRR